MRNQPHILCVDDYEDTLDMLAVLLSNYKLTLAPNYADALQQVEKKLFDLYLIDNLLPDGNGIEMCKRICKRAPNTPILFYTAAASDIDRQKAIRAGAHLYLIKPVDIFRLLDAVASLILKSQIASIEAKVAETDALHDYLKERHHPLTERLTNLRNRSVRSIARQAFIESGGSRANFERMWPDMLKGETAKDPISARTRQ